MYKGAKKNESAENDIVDAIAFKELLDSTKALLKSGDLRTLKKNLNSASWNIKRVLLEHLVASGDIKRANKLASEIIGYTEPKKQEIEGHLQVDQRAQVIVAELEGVPFELLAKRAEQIRREIEEGRTGPDRIRDEASGPEEVLDVEAGTLQE